jgi:hypothetical protein
VCVTDHERLVEVRVQDLLNTVDEPPTQSIWCLKRNQIPKTRKDLRHWWNSKWMSQEPSKKTSCSFNACVWSLPSTTSLPGILEGSQNDSSAKAWQNPKISRKFTSD